jgi:succinoglycan biosynthesis transport protein ExoP
VIERVGQAVEDLLKTAHTEYDMVFIDAPPTLSFAEPIRLAGAADGVLVICRAGRTSKEDVLRVFTQLERLGALPLGLVLNQVHQKMSPQYGGYQSYYSRTRRVADAA